jgi:hypothetical protein
MCAKHRRSYAFTCVRNPYTRILSSFFDKICGIQRNGKRYRGNLVPLLVQKYGIEVGGPDGKQEFDQIASFRRFLLFARDTSSAGKSRWSPTSTGRRCRVISRPSSSTAGAMTTSSSPRSSTRACRSVLDNIETKHPGRPGDIPRFNESEGHGPKRAHPVEDYFDDLSMHLMWEIYKRDFQLFRYDFDNPANKMPLGEIDLAEVHAKLGDSSAPALRNHSTIAARSAGSM